MPGLAAQVESRAQRGLELWRSRRLEMEVRGDGVWLVPSGTREELRHRVSTLEETCSCRDAAYHPEHRCKHRWCVEYELALQQALAEVADIADIAGFDAPYSSDATGAHGRWLR